MWLHEWKGKNRFWTFWIQTDFKEPVLALGSCAMFDLMEGWFLRLGLSLAAEIHPFGMMQSCPVNFRGNMIAVKVVILYLALRNRTFFENVKPYLGKHCSGIEASPVNQKQLQSAFFLLVWWWIWSNTPSSARRWWRLCGPKVWTVWRKDPALRGQSWARVLLLPLTTPVNLGWPCNRLGLIFIICNIWALLTFHRVN